MGVDIIGASRAEILEQVPEWPIHRRITPEEVTHILEVCDAYWVHNGDPAMPHALLTSDKHSDGFVNAGKALVYPVLSELFADQLGILVRQVYDGPIDWVVASDHAAATIGYAVSNRFGVHVRYDFTEKDPDPKKKDQHWGRHEVAEGEAVLQVEELITTLLTMQAVRAGLRRATPTRSSSPRSPPCSSTARVRPRSKARPSSRSRATTSRPGRPRSARCASRAPRPSAPRRGTGQS